MTDFMQGDKAYAADIAKTQSVEEILELSRHARDRGLAANGVTRNPITGQFESAVRDAAAQEEATRAAAANAGERPYTRTVTIAGKEIEFSNSDHEMLERDIQSALQVAEVLQAPTRQEQTDLERQRALMERVELERQFKTGQITTAEFLQKSGAVGEYLESQGISIDTLRANAQKHEADTFQQSWAQATDAFLQGPGAMWPGGNRNLAQIQTAIAALGLQDQPSVESLVKAYDYLKTHNTLFERETTQKEIIDSLKDNTPQEILEIWKRSHEGFAAGDASKANEDFINAFRRR
jgi:hypothetical protein